MSISAFRLGNYAQFDGELQIIETQTGLDNAAFLDPLPISTEVFKQLGFKELEETYEYSIYLFKTGRKGGISVVFNSQYTSQYLIMEQFSRIEYPFIKWVHELQNLVADKKHFKPAANQRERISITVL